MNKTEEQRLTLTDGGGGGIPDFELTVTDTVFPRK